ncbi:MAG: hypothetical protein R2751_13880 [Bacteroidales bacterium]
MRLRSIPALAILALLISCQPESEVFDRTQVELRMAVPGFEVAAEESLKKETGGVYDAFVHKYQVCNLYMNGENAYYSLQVDNPAEGRSLQVLLGGYMIGGYAGWSGPLGAPAMSYDIRDQHVSVGTAPDDILLQMANLCALVLIADPDDQLADAYVQDASGNRAAEMYQDGIYTYAYFNPEQGYTVVVRNIRDDSLEIPVGLLLPGKTRGVLLEPEAVK